MKKCLFCKKELSKDYFENKIGYFCSEDHFDEYLKSLSKEEYVELQNSFCVCSDD
ncbi:hypothetical protein H8S10_14520 [Clostridium sp. NSJ-49]|uniref:TRASH domain-containing protein n=1 Tax=Clostridium disporicum TaxID=84024 RepID=A0A174KLG9_9CLOT|nr:MULTISPECIES: hypothetical protein [Clostridium]MBC5626664.1 hypothetical protein [Clostridium sp. NSJ-49]MCD2502392.1 hypothetical protein [Clostridium sp. NSJ-145]CUP11346.1 Uncharacterised protein [Clostridium disporicum]